MAGHWLSRLFSNLFRQPGHPADTTHDLSGQESARQPESQFDRIVRFSSICVLIASTQENRYVTAHAMLTGLIQGCHDGETSCIEPVGFEGLCRSLRARVGCSLGDYDQAGDDLDLAWGIFTAQADHQGRIQVLNERANLQAQLGNLANATECRNLAADEAAKSGTLEETILTLCRDADARRRHDAAGAQPVACSVLYYSLLSYHAENIIRSLFNLGMVHQSAKRHEEACAAFDGAKRMATQIRDRRGNDNSLPSIEGHIHIAQAISYHRLGRYAEAEQGFAAALHTFDLSSSPQHGILCLQNRAAFRLDLGAYEQAKSDLQTAIELAGSAGEERVADAQERSIRKANLLMLLGSAHDGLGDYRRALSCLEEALRLVEKEPPLRNHEMPDVPYLYLPSTCYPETILNDLGVIYTNTGLRDQALHCFRQALAFISRAGANSALMATCHNNIGTVYLSRHRYDEALQQFQAARDRVGTGDLLAIADINTNLAVARLSRNDLNPEQIDEIRGNLEIAARIYRQAQNDDRLSDVLNNYGSLAERCGQFDQAVDFHLQALDLRRSIGNRHRIAASYHHLAAAYDAMGRITEALDAYQNALHTFEDLLVDIQPTEMGAFRETNLGSLSRNYTSLLIRQSRIEEALIAAERGRVQGLARQATDNRVDGSRLLSPEDRQQLHALQAQLRSLRRLWLTYQTLPESAKRNDVQDSGRQDLEDQLKSVENRLTTLQEALYSRYPRFRQLYGVESLSPDLFRSIVAAAPDALFLEYVVLDERHIALFALCQREDLRCWMLEIGRQELMDLISEWRSQLARPPRDSKTLTHNLYVQLLAPLEEHHLLMEPKRVVIVADGPLLDLPFGALVDNDGARLAERFAISYSFSLAALHWSDVDVCTVPISRFLCVANPMGYGGLPSLPAVEAEARRLLAMLPRDLEQRLLVGPEATETNVCTALQELPPGAILHFAMHALLDEENGLRSALILALPEIETTSDTTTDDTERGQPQRIGMLEARDIAHMLLRARLVTLAACETARGHTGGGEGLMGLVWAFRAAGCPIIVGSQWRVDDKATSELMACFYRNLLAGLEPDSAMQRAVIEIQTIDKSWRHPYYWAGFQVFGSACAPMPPV